MRHQHGPLLSTIIFSLVELGSGFLFFIQWPLWTIFVLILAQSFISPHMGLIFGKLRYIFGILITARLFLHIGDTVIPWIYWGISFFCTKSMTTLGILDGTVGSSHAGYTPFWRMAFSAEFRLLGGTNIAF